MIQATLRPLLQDATHTTPAVRFEPEQGILSLVGRAMPIDAGLFFEPLLRFIERYARQPAAETVFVCHLDYFNSGSSMLLGRLFAMLNQVPNLRVEWRYHPDDEDLLEAGQEFAHICHQPFTYMPTPD